MKKKRVTFKLNNWRIPREAYIHGFTWGPLWSTPTVYRRLYPNAEMTATGSRVCTGQTESTSCWMLENEVMIEAVNKHAFSWNALLQFIRKDLSRLIPDVLEKQATYLQNCSFPQGHDKDCECCRDALLVLNAFYHNLQVAIIDFMNDDIEQLMPKWKQLCEQLLLIHDTSEVRSCPQQEFLLHLLQRGGAVSYVPMQIKIWEAKDEWSLLPLTGQLPEVGPDMEDLGIEKAWDCMWFATEDR